MSTVSRNIQRSLKINVAIYSALTSAPYAQQPFAVAVFPRAAFDLPKIAKIQSSMILISLIGTFI